MSNSPPPVVITKSPDYRTIPVSNIFTALIETEGKLLVFTDKLEPSVNQDGHTILGKVVRELQVELQFSPQEYKAVAHAMTGIVKVFEEKHKVEIKPVEEAKKAMYS